MADAVRRDTVVGCTPAGADDEACMTDFVTHFGRRALRRPLSNEEKSRYVNGTPEFPGAMADASEAGDFYAGVHTVVWAFLQHPELLYRVEIGLPVQGAPEVVKLTPFELASRLSFFILGTMPDDALLDKAETGALEGASARRDVALSMFQDERAKARALRFHAMWLGYEVNPHVGELAQGMELETEALIERVVFTENLPWAEILTFPETKPEAPSDCVGWHVKHMARLVSLLKNSQEVNGSSLLDNTAIVMLFEGGVGYDPEGVRDGVTHSTEICTRACRRAQCGRW